MKENERIVHMMSGNDGYKMDKRNCCFCIFLDSPDPKRDL